jgi:hypothetical protein
MKDTKEMRVRERDESDERDEGEREITPRLSLHDKGGPVHDKGGSYRPTYMKELRARW